MLTALVAIMATCGCASAQVSFADHYTFAKDDRLGPREAAFAMECGVDTNTATLTYGVATDGGFDFGKTEKLANTDQAVLDQFGSAQMWSVGEKPRMLNAWFLFVKSGKSFNELLCMTSAGHMSLQETLNVDQTPSATTTKFIHVLRYRFPSNNQRVLINSKFLDKAGKPTAAPKLTAAELSEIGSSSRNILKYTVDALKPGAKQR